jgi:hypothetical protein
LPFKVPLLDKFILDNADKISSGPTAFEDTVLNGDEEQFSFFSLEVILTPTGGRPGLGILAT